jgi:peptidoglycan hydrolase-like protein with peptidoglycan-binding domain
MKKILTFIFVFALSLVALDASAATNCSFTRDLEIGSTGEDVRCLQKYLNANGFKIADSGVGSPGNETSPFP